MFYSICKKFVPLAVVSAIVLQTLACFGFGVPQAQGYSADRYLLWTNDSGEASLWTLDSSNDYVSQESYAYGNSSGWSGWRATDYYRSEDGSTRYLLWTNDSGEASLWTLDSSNDYAGQKTYECGTDYDWRATGYDIDEDGSTRYLLWTDIEHSWTVLWVLDEDNNYLGYQDYGREAGWVASDYKYNENDANGYMLWTQDDGTAGLWTLDDENNYIKEDTFYHSTDGWQAESYWNNLPGITVRDPEGGEVWQKGHSYNVVFDYGSEIYSARIYLYESSKQTLTSLGDKIYLYYAPSSYIASVTVPSTVVGDNDYRIMVRGYDYYGSIVAEDYSDGYFTINKTSGLTVLSPNGGEYFETGYAYNIRYNTSDVDTVRIDLYRDGGWYIETITTITNLVGGDHHYTWTVPSYLTSASDYKIRVIKHFDSSVYDESDYYFSIGQDGEIADGSLIRNPSASGMARFDVYIVKLINGKRYKRLILSPHVFLSYDHLDPNDVILVDQATMDSYITSDLVRAEGDHKVYKLYPTGDTGEKRWIISAEVFDRLGYDWDAIYVINTTDRNAYWTGPNLE